MVSASTAVTVTSKSKVAVAPRTTLIPTLVRRPKPVEVSVTANSLVSDWRVTGTRLLTTLTMRRGAGPARAAEKKRARQAINFAETIMGYSLVRRRDAKGIGSRFVCGKVGSGKPFGCGFIGK
ncbi:unnamed protein product [Chondrus crispus]|uniref:Uncharacterized protein n=1 Tax=Chondrus crispus TaxID=2769 RepID=R7Q6B3_CHOCR|nr:unnamed protein product [Chondrus crispus]CDF32931.1 unnamed protein product [Chondrus crispus]|eukprot:XP_005712734.1 unnamed protein product [Chondrus crispus]